MLVGLNFLISSGSFLILKIIKFPGNLVWERQLEFPRLEFSAQGQE